MAKAKLMTTAYDNEPDYDDSHWPERHPQDTLDRLRACDGDEPAFLYHEWFDELDKLTLRRSGFSLHDLPDMPFHDAFDAGMPVDEFFAEEVQGHLAELGWEDDD